MTRPKLELELLRIAKLQQELVREGGFYLAGGSGLSIRLGHRFSEDLDWFTAKPFSANELADKLGTLSKKPSKIEKQGPQECGALDITALVLVTRVAREGWPVAAGSGGCGSPCG